MPKNHMILIEIKERSVLSKKKKKKKKKKTAKHHRKKTAKIQTDIIYMAFGPIISSFSVKQDFSVLFPVISSRLNCNILFDMK